MSVYFDKHQSQLSLMTKDEINKYSLKYVDKKGLFSIGSFIHVIYICFIYVKINIFMNKLIYIIIYYNLASYNYVVI